MIHVKGEAEALDSSAAISILVQLQRHGVAIHTVCGGRAQCGRCVIRVIRGAEAMNRPNERERLRLKALGAGPDMRLACQSYTRGSIEIEIINTGPASPGLGAPAPRGTDSAARATDAPGAPGPGPTGVGPGAPGTPSR